MNPIFKLSSGSWATLSVMSPETVLTGLVCSNDRELSHAVARLMHASGFEVLGIPETVADAISAVARALPSAVVIDASVLGARGLAVLSDVLDAAPTCSVVVVSPFSALAQPAVAAGAAALVDPSDLRPLRTFLDETRVAAHAGYACTCCGTVSTSTPVVFDFDTPPPPPAVGTGGSIGPPGSSSPREPEPGTEPESGRGDHTGLEGS